MANALDEKLNLIQEYIDRLDECISDKNFAQTKELQKEIISVFRTEIAGIKNGLDNYSTSRLYGDCGPVDYLGDAKKLKAKLINYKANLKSGLTKLQSNDGVVNVTQNVSQENVIDFAMSLESVINVVNELPTEMLTDEDKEILSGKLANISAEKDKSKRWEKVGNALKWIADKSVDVGKAALPYIIKAITEGN